MCVCARAAGVVATICASVRRLLPRAHTRVAAHTDARTHTQEVFVVCRRGVLSQEATHTLLRMAARGDFSRWFSPPPLSPPPPSPTPRPIPRAL